MKMIVVLPLLALAQAAIAAPAFPGAEGHGAQSLGGRGGRIIAVTTLADAGPGSLRSCIDAVGPRVCVFRVSGIIRFTTVRPLIRNSRITIAGETAPGGGILVTHAGGAKGYTPIAIVGAHDVVIRHIRVRTDRRGDDRGANGAFTIERSRNVILDHVSGSWALDQNLSGYDANDAITVSWSIFAEGIPRHDKCALLASNPRQPQRFSFIKTLCAHNGDRNPDANFPPGSCVEITNNILYNAQSQFTEIWESEGGTPVSVVGNIFRRGPNTSGSAVAIDRVMIGSRGTARIHAADNRIDGKMQLFSPVAEIASVPDAPCAAVTPPLATSLAYERVLSESGALPRDSFDARIAHDVIMRSGRIVRDPGQLPAIAAGAPYPDLDRDGMDDRWETANGANPRVPDPWADGNRDSWLNLENFLDWRHRRLVQAQRAVFPMALARHSLVARIPQPKAQSSPSAPR
jgi:pectate lyase